MRSKIGWVCLTATGVVAASAGAALAGTLEVPEPSSLALLAVGLGAAAWAKFRRPK